jgi:hypothetical protein
VALIAAVIAANVAVPVDTPSLSVSPPEPVTFVQPLPSLNWSGYAVVGRGFTSVTGEWVVPAVTPSKGSTYSSSWLGIGGLFGNSNLIQTGTEQDFVDGAASYDAWWEILPAGETAISRGTIDVQPGDVMTASISLPCDGALWTITITDMTRRQSFTTQKYYGGQRSSAEWIEEATLVGGRIAQLAHIGTTVFGPGTVDGFDRANIPDGDVMIQLTGPESTPSQPAGDMHSFTVQYGSARPASSVATT